MKELVDWFLFHRRNFPWRKNPTPYQVWVSEVMLQQTQASRVIDFYERWMERFPTVKALATASIEEVLKCWEGLGYYSRARLLHSASREIMQRFGGTIPHDPESLRSIKGLGPYTVGAILAFGFHKKAVAVDGNVMRVLARLFEIADDISKAKSQSLFRQKALDLLPDKEPHIFSEALIELGAVVCRPKPNCHHCPLQQMCQSYQNGTQRNYPVKSQKVCYELLHREVAVIYCQDKILLRQGKEGIACSGLFEFPYFSCQEGGMSHEHARKEIESQLGLRVSFTEDLGTERQSFTRFRVTLYPKLYHCHKIRGIADHHWYNQEEIDTLTFSSGHKRILTRLKKSI